MLVIGGKAHSVAQVQRQRQDAEPLVCKLRGQILKPLDAAGNEPNPLDLRKYLMDLAGK